MKRATLLAAILAALTASADLRSAAIAVTNAAAQIDAAIFAKGGTTTGGLTAAPAAIAALPSGGSGEAGNGLPMGCPRIDLITMSPTYEEIYVVEDARSEPANEQHSFNTYWTISADGVEIREVEVANDGTVTETSNVVIRDSLNSGVNMSLYGGRYNVMRLRARGSGTFSYINFNYGHSMIIYRTAARARASCLPGWASSFGRQSQWSVCCWYKHTNPSQNAIKCEIFYGGTMNLLLDGNFYPSLVEVYSLNPIKFIGVMPENSVRIGSVHCCKIDFSDADFSNVASFAYSQGLQNIYTKNLVMPSDPDKGMRVSFTIQNNNGLLDVASLMSIINSLYDHTAHGTGQTPTLTMGSTYLNLLTVEQKAIATNKGWTLQ